MKRNVAILGGIGLAAGVMYFLDPTAGRRRRALVRDKMFGWTRRGRRTLDAAATDMSNRIQGTISHMGTGEHGHVVDDPVLESRIRSRMGHVVSHPSSIAVGVEGGRVVLTGDVLASEVNGLMRTIADTPGVSSAENRLKTHESAENIPALQGTGRRSMNPATWTPRTWALVGITAGGIGSMYGIRSMLGRRRSMSFWMRAFRAAPRFWMRVMSYVAAYDLGRLRRWSPESMALAGATAATLSYYGTRAVLDRRAPKTTWERVKSAMPDMSAITRMVPEIPSYARHSFSRRVH